MFRNTMNPQTEFFLALFVAGIFVVGAFLTGWWATIAYGKWDKLTSSSTGKISGKILDKEKPYIINIGGNTREVTGEELRKGININRLVNNLFTITGDEIDLPVKMYEENNRLLFDVNIIDKGKPVFTVIANEFVFNPNGKFDRNYNINGVEIVDENLIPQIQIYLQDGNKIYIGGSSRTDNNFLAFTYSGTFLNPTKEQLTENVKTFFKYPSSKNLGVVIKENLPDFSEIDARILESEKLKAKINELSKLSNAELSFRASSLANSIDELQNKYTYKLNTEQAEQKAVLSEDNHNQLLLEYNSQYKTDVLAILQVIKSRLALESSKELMSVRKIEWSATNPYWFKQNISSSLRKAAILLP